MSRLEGGLLPASGMHGVAARTGGGGRTPRSGRTLAISRLRSSTVTWTRCQPRRSRADIDAALRPLAAVAVHPAQSDPGDATQPPQLLAAHDHPDGRRAGKRTPDGTTGPACSSAWAGQSPARSRQTPHPAPHRPTAAACAPELVTLADRDAVVGERRLPVAPGHLRRHDDTGNAGHLAAVCRHPAIGASRHRLGSVETPTTTRSWAMSSTSPRTVAYALHPWTTRPRSTSMPSSDHGQDRLAEQRPTFRRHRHGPARHNSQADRHTQRSPPSTALTPGAGGRAGRFTVRSAARR